MDFGSDPPNPKARRGARVTHRSKDFGAGRAVLEFGTEPVNRNPHGEGGEACTPGLCYVTRATFKYLAGRNIEATGCPPLESVFSAIFHRDLGELLNVPEARRLYALKLMAEQKFSEVRVTTRHFSRQYVFKVASPKFHTSDACELLRSDFVNYRVPPEIKALGDEKVRQFQEFCDANKALLQENNSEKFWRHVGAHFRVPISNERVHYANSGIQELRELSSEQLSSAIENLFAAAMTILEDGTCSAQVKQVRFAIDRKKACSSIRDPIAVAAVNRWFDLKFEIMDALLELYLKQAGAKGFLLPESLLRHAGLEPCKGCQLSPAVTWD